jgi:hypothetical protein
MRQFLEYTILENKKTVTKRGAIKKKGDASQSLRQATKKRPFEPTTVNPEEVPQKKKKQAIPLAASSVRRTPPKSPAPETNTKKGSISFRGFVPEVSSTRGTRVLQSFHLRDEPSSKGSHNGLEANLEAPLSKLFAVKLRLVICHKNVWYSESTNN